MKKLILFIFLASCLYCEDVEDGEIDDTIESETFAEAPPVKKSSIEKRNWIFAAGSAVAAAIAIIIVSINQGDSPPSHH